MVFCGKPSKACLECRVKRRKCDKLKPACRQCVRAGARCDGYRDQSSVAFRHQTAESMRQSHLNLPNSGSIGSYPGDQAGCKRSPYQKATADGFKDGLDNELRMGMLPQHLALEFFSHHYLMNGTKQPISHPVCMSIMYTRASECRYLADLISAVGVISLAHVRNLPSLALVGGRLYSAALRHMHVALADPAEAISDQILVAVMLLALYETVNCDPDDSLSAWDRHVAGALAIVELRGIGQLRNRVGRSIFFKLRNKILFSCLQRRLDVPVSLTRWMSEAQSFESAKEAPIGRLAGIVVSACALLASIKESRVARPDISGCVSALLSMDEALERWAENLEAEYGYTTSETSTNHEDPFMQRYDLYPGIEIANTWNLQRCARITLRQAIIEILPLNIDLSCSHSALSSSYYQGLLHTSDMIIQQNTNDICYSVPYIFNFHEKTGGSGDMRATCAISLLWPLYVAGKAHPPFSTTREWVLAQLKKIEEVTGIQRAKSMALDIQKG